MDNYFKGRFAMVKRISLLELAAIHAKEKEIYDDNMKKIGDGTISYHEYYWFLHGLNSMRNLVVRYGGFWPKSSTNEDKLKMLESFYQNIYTMVDGFYDAMAKIDIVTDIDIIHKLDDIIQEKVSIDTYSSSSSSLMDKINGSKKNEKKSYGKTGGQTDEFIYPADGGHV